MKSLAYATAIILSIFCAYIESTSALYVANLVASSFVIALKWLSIPMITLAMLSTTSSLQNSAELYSLGRSVLKYTLLTTLIASSIAYSFFMIINPADPSLSETIIENSLQPTGSPIFGILLIGSILAAIISSLVILSINELKREIIQTKISFAYQNLMRLIRILLKAMPIAVWAFVTLFLVEVNGLMVKSLGLYLACILLANLTQALVVLPTILKLKSISPMQTFKAMLPALMVAFWSKSSAVALPVAVTCAKDRLGVSKKIANFSLPLCITINMNACAAFILTTVLFVSMSYGHVYTGTEYLLWILVATLAAIGNAGVPMGCYTLSGAILAYLGVPLYLLGIILPAYSLIDMLESAINVWSDSCVTALVERDSDKLLSFLASQASAGDVTP